MSARLKYARSSSAFAIPQSDFLHAIKFLKLVKTLAKEYNIVVLFTAFRGKINEVRKSAKEEDHFFRPFELKSLPMRAFFAKYKDTFTFSKLRGKISDFRDRRSANRSEQ